MNETKIADETKKLVSMDKKYKTRDGRDVRVICVDALSSNFTVVALVEGYRPATFTRFGNHYIGGDSPLDLIEQPEEKTVWLEIYRYSHWDNMQLDGVNNYDNLEELTKAVKDNHENYQLIAIKKVVYKEGDGE